MTSKPLFVLVALGATLLPACVNGLASSEGAALVTQESIDPLPIADGADPAGAQDSGDARPSPDGPADDGSPAGGDGSSGVPGDADGDGVVDAGEPGPPPADAGQSCAVWTDCGPHYDNLNSGFDCVSHTCTCDDTGQWAAACAELGGAWSRAECFCFTGTDTAMPSDEPEPPADADEDVVCWWTWRLRYCDPDRWVDESYTERVCDDHGCWNEIIDDGYWIEGECYGRWIKRCTDGNEYWY